MCSPFRSEPKFELETGLRGFQFRVPKPPKDNPICHSAAPTASCLKSIDVSVLITDVDLHHELSAGKKEEATFVSVTEVEVTNEKSEKS